MAYTPDNNPYIPGDPYSYDLKWQVDNIKHMQTRFGELDEQVQEATDQADRAEQEADRAAGRADFATDQADRANIEALKSEGYATGTQNGEAVAAGSPYFENNSKYYSEESAASAAEAADYAAHIADPVAGLVASWLAQHIDPDTGYVIDSSLTIANAAADAKTVGDKFTEITTIINNIVTPFDDLVYPVASGSYCQKGGKLYAARMTIAADEGWVAGHWRQCILASELLNILNSLEPDILAAFASMIVTPFDDLVYPVASGSYCQRGGKLYAARMTIAADEGWVTGHWRQCILANEIIDIVSNVPNTVMNILYSLIVTPFDDLVYPVIAGSYCERGGHIYAARMTIAADEGWVSGHWRQCILANEIRDMQHEKLTASDVFKIVSPVVSLNDTPYNDMLSVYNGAVISKSVSNNVLSHLADSGYIAHDGTIIYYNNMLLCVFCSYTGRGDAASNPNATVQLKILNANDGSLLAHKVIAKMGDAHGTMSQDGGSGSPNAYLVNNVLHILYTAKINGNYREMHCAYDVATDTILSYDAVLVNGIVLDNAWIRSQFPDIAPSYPDGAYTSAQANSTIAADPNNNYYIGYVLGYNTTGKALIFSTADFINWSIFWMYDKNTLPVYELALAYSSVNRGNIVYAIRPYSSSRYGILGKINISSGKEWEYTYFKNCGSRPAFFRYGGILYLITNPNNRDEMQLIQIDENVIGYSQQRSFSYGGYNYPSFTFNGNKVFILRSNNSMEVSAFNFSLITDQAFSSIIESIFSI